MKKYKFFSNDMTSYALCKKLLWIIFGTLITTYGILYQQAQPTNHSFFVNHEFLHYDLDKEEPQEVNQSCQLPRIHPFDSSILSYLTPPKPILCKERNSALTFVDDEGFLQFNLTALRMSGYLVKKLRCEYKEIIRVNDFEVKYGETKEMRVNGSRLSSDFVFVSCYNFAGISFYTNIHCHVYKNESFSNGKISSRDSKSMYNVLLIGIDSLSRLSFMRNLPKTYKFLVNNLNAFVFKGMTKIGDNTFPNLAAILTGKSVFENELPDVVEPEGTYDKWPCLWKNFSDAGHVTLLAEDRPDINTFNYFRGGFKDPPTDHYMRPFWLAVQTSTLHRLSSSLCFGNTPKHLVQLKYTKDFISKYIGVNQPFFAFSFLVELSHDYLVRVASADTDFETWLKDLFNSGYLNKTFLFFLSDHGHRFDPMRATLVGRIEERMPFLALVVPKTVLDSNEEVAENLEINERRLTTPYDIHFTVLDILNFNRNVSEFGSLTSKRGTSLFGSISSERSCAKAGIPDHYCVCEEEKELKPTDPKSYKAATALVSSINQLLQSHRNFCSPLSLVDVHRADLIVPRREVIVNSRIYFGNLLEDSEAKGMFVRVRVIARTEPGHALFEGTLLFRDNNISVVGDISRINPYGSQSACLQHAVLRKFCYCLNKTDGT